MKAGKLQTLWIMLLSASYMVYTCGRAAIKHLQGTITRKWCDEELQRWTQRMIKLLRIQWKVYNPHNVEPIAGQPTIILCNHSSLFDIPLSLLAFPKHSLRMLSKKELARIPIMGQGMLAAEFPLIDRKNRRQAIKDLEAIHDLLESGIVMWIAAEGTRSKDGKLAPFKKGPFITAIQTKATIIPIGIRGAYDILPARSFQFNLNQKAEIHIGQPIDASQYTLENKEELIARAFDCMKELVEDPN